MIIDCISDLHGHYPKLDGGDLLIVAGNLTARDNLKELDEFNEWIREQYYKKKVLIAGNHDNLIARGVYDPYNPTDCSVFVDPSVDYLFDSGTEFEYEIYCNMCGTPTREYPNRKCSQTVMCSGEKNKLRIWGSPWTKTFPGINPKCCAFTVHTDEELKEKWDLIPHDTDILITHCPPWGVFDEIPGKNIGIFIETGSISLRNKCMSMTNLKLHVFGNIHEHGGKVLDTTRTKWVNASHVDERYRSVNKPIRIIL
jgi:Icc-related predicted phosphoesterase